MSIKNNSKRVIKYTRNRINKPFLFKGTNKKINKIINSMTNRNIYLII